MTVSAPVTLPFEFKGVVRFTKIGTTYLGATIVLAASAVNTGNNALYLGVALMLGSLLLSGIASRGGLKHLSVEIAGLGEAWAGRPAGGMLLVRNESRLWNVRDVILVSEAFAEPVLVPLLPRRQTVEVPASFLFRRRGLAHVQTIDSYTRYPFGFFLKKRRLRVNGEVIVYPPILSDEVPPELFRASAGEQTVQNRPGPGSEIHSYREYVHGDSLRHVHWKKSASLGRWIMKQTDAEASQSVHVLVDPYLPFDVSEDAFEEMVAAATTFIYHAARRGFDVTLALPRVTLRAGREEAVAPLFRALALVEVLREPVAQLIERNSVVFSVGGGRRDVQSA